MAYPPDPIVELDEKIKSLQASLSAAQGSINRCRGEQDGGGLEPVQSLLKDARQKLDEIIRDLDPAQPEVPPAPVLDRGGREAELNQLNRTLKAFVLSNQAMLHAESEGELLDSICQIVRETCGYSMVWIGFRGEDREKIIHPAVQCGFNEGYIDALQLSWDESEGGRGPAGTALRSGQTVICRNLLTDPRFLLWREEAIQNGFGSSIYLPLSDEDSPFGLLAIYSSQADPFSDDEIRLLSELAHDLSHGIIALRLRAAHSQAEKALQASEERFRSLFEGMTEGFALHEIICDEHGQPYDYRFLEINPSFERMTGLKRPAVIGRRMTEVLPGDDPKWIQAYGGVALTGWPVHFENYSPVLQRYYDVIAYRPAPLQFAVIFMDITERKQLEAALRAAHDELEQRVKDRTAELNQANVELTQEIAEHELAESKIRQNAARAEALAEIASRLAVTNLDQQTVFDTITEAAGKAIGDSCAAWLLSEDQEQLIPISFYLSDPQVLQTARKAFHSPLQVVMGGIIGQVIQSGKATIFSQNSLEKLAGPLEPELKAMVKLTHGNSGLVVPVWVEGQISGALALTRDHPGQAYTEEDLVFLQSMADRAAIAIVNMRLYQDLEKALQNEKALRGQLIQIEKNLALNRMVASIAHEINNPIQTILNCLFMIREDTPGNLPLQETLGMALGETRRIANLVKQLRELYRPNPDKSLHSLELGSILEEVHGLLKTHLQHECVLWEQDPLPAGLQITGIEDQVKQVFLNICLNAIESMQPAGGVIQVETVLDPIAAEVGIVFKDTGPGIPPENLDRLFEPFFTTKNTGTGLGLAITFDIVRNHGGRITAANRPEHGAVFTIWLPVEIAPPPVL